MYSKNLSATNCIITRQLFLMIGSLKVTHELIFTIPMDCSFFNYIVANGEAGSGSGSGTSEETQGSGSDDSTPSPIPSPSTPPAPCKYFCAFIKNDPVGNGIRGNSFPRPQGLFTNHWSSKLNT